MPLRLSPRAHFARRLALLVAVALLSNLLPFNLAPRPASAAGLRTQTDPAEAGGPETPGALRAVGPGGKGRGFCPLKHTDVRAEVSGFVSRVTVTQEFENPFDEKIEAVYIFPLPQAAAVDDMTMKVGDRVVRGKIMRREEAQAAYEAARRGGQVAALLDQERPNVFTQSVANVMPGERVTVRISYVETLRYEGGAYEFTFPTVVGPRYIPKSADAAPARVPDAGRILPPVAGRGERAGHDISIEVSLDAGVPLDALASPSHEIDAERTGPTSARVRLRRRSTIPNKDFILRYDVAGRRVEDALLAHRDGRGGYFALILQPPERVAVEDVTPKELVFVLDTSGSMSGFPIEKAKETMRLALAGLYPQDTFNLITFAGDTDILFPQPVPATPENLRKAHAFLEDRRGGGGTEMMKAIRAALSGSSERPHVRIVCFMTDGYVGDDMGIIAEVQRHPNARVFSFGIGDGVNRFLLDKMAEHGRGEVEYVTLKDDGSAAARRFHERVRNPLLTDISVDWAGLPVADVYPKRIPDLFSAKPVVLSGRYTGAGRGAVRLRGRMGGQYFERELSVNLPESQPDHEALASLWARRRVADLMAEDYAGTQRGQTREDVRETVTQLGLEYRLMTQFTSFVAVEEVTITDGGEPRRVEVPVELPSGSFGGEATTREIRALPLSGRSHSNMVSLSAGVTETVEVTAAAPSAVSRAPGTTVIDQSMIDPGTLLMRGGAGKPKEAKPDPEEQRRRRLAAKFHPSVLALVERLEKKSAAPAGGDGEFVRDGKAEVQVWLAEKSPAVLAQLTRLGLEVIADPQTARLVIVRVPVEKLAALAELEAVLYVWPQ
ncbi:MAG TPA: VIT and VWA domain-containing protein [Pyrinomonadaceae bacterium]|nr:VIT and VWA domain-containing protein [Pyrinomonadaceae bacterium]